MLESLSNDRWYRKLVFFDKIVNDLSPTYLTAYLSNATLPSPLLLGLYYKEQNTLKIHFVHTGLVKGTNAEIKKLETLGKFR